MNNSDLTTAPAPVVDTIRFGDRITIVNRFGQRRRGRAVMRGSHGWVISLDTKYGSPAIANDANIVRIERKRRTA